jgi:hypothetical protein
MLLARMVLVFLYNRLTDLNVDPATGDYYPTVFFNEFWLLRDKLIALNETVEELPLNLEVGPISMTKWQLFLQIEQSFQVHRSYGSMLEGEADELKVYKRVYSKVHLVKHNIYGYVGTNSFAVFHPVNYVLVFCILEMWFLSDDSFLIFVLQRVFLEGNPYLLGLTMVVSLLHSLFDFLAFKNGMYNI